MPGSPQPPRIRRLRHEHALALLAAGEPFSASVVAVAEKWGCSRRTSRNVCRAALDEIVADVDVQNVQDLLATTIERLQRVAAKAEASNQLAVAVGAMNALHRIVIQPHQDRDR